MTHPLAKPAALVAILAACGATSACGSLGRSMGMNAQAPDEFRVVTRAPLELPPDYSLRPPRPGEARPQEAAPTEAARAALFGQDIGQNASEGERALVGAAGAATADASIRQQVDFEGANIVYRSEQFSDRVIQEGQPNAPAQTEEQRTAEQESIRRATGDGEVTIERGSTNTRLPGT